MRATVFTDYDLLETEGTPGSFMYAGRGHGQDTMIMRCPGCGSISALPLTDQGDRFPKWSKSGADELPTLSPSVFHTKDKGGCGWHGFLQEGIWKSI